MLEHLKSSVLKIAKHAQHEGLCKHKSGNFSARDPETGYIVVTPSGADRDILSISDMIVMDSHANVIENLTGLRPTSEALMHLKLYEIRPRLAAVVHTHSLYATVFAILGRPIPAVVYEIANLNCSRARVPVAPYARPGTPALADAIREPAMEADVMLLQGHGCVAMDEHSIEDAYLKACYLEELATLYYHALNVNGGKEPPCFPAEELQKWEYPKEIKFPAIHEA